MTRCSALLAALALPVTLLGSSPATAEPRVQENPSPTGEEFLPTKRSPLQLMPGARDVRVAESPFGGAVAVTWRVRNGSGTDEVWARVKDEKAWGPNVRVSDPGASATRHTMDLDSDGSLLVAWAERRGSARTLVARRVTGGALGKRQVFTVATDDGPYVAAGALHDVVAWTAPQGGVVRPFAAVDTGGGFTTPAVVSSPQWRYDVLPDTLTVNADGPQVHALYLSDDSDVGWAQTSWSVLDSTQGTTWVPTDDIGPRQQLRDGPLTRPQVVATSRGLAIHVLHATDETVEPQVRYPTGQLFDPAKVAPLRERLTEVRSLEVVAEDGPRDLRSLHNRQDVLMASYSGSAFLKRLALPSSQDFDFQDTVAAAGCTPFDSWFYVNLESPELVCLDTETAPTGVDLVLDSMPTEPLKGVRPDPALPGSRVTAQVPDPLVPLVLLTEDVAGATDPVWLLDLTMGGSDRPAPLLKFTKVKGPRITGKLVVGQKLKAVTGTWRPGPAEVAHRWFVNGKIVKGATSPTFALTKKHRGKRISAKLYLSRAGFADEVIQAKRAQKVKAKPKKKKGKKKK